MIPKTGRWAILILLLLWGSSAQWVSADISLAKIFADHMVLQQQTTVKVWGTAEPGDELILKFDKQQKEFVADAEGNWSTTIETPKHGGPYEISVTLQKGGPKILISDVLIGEVWLCSGQSNMEWKVRQSLNPQTEKEQAKSYPNIRYFSIDRSASPKPLEEFLQARPWDVCGTDTVSEFSAVAYFFGRELSKKLDVPIGLIDCTWGGTRAEAWVSDLGLKANAELKPLMDYWAENDNPTSKDRPANLFNGMVHPLKGVAFRGVIWYQGESNVGRGAQYATLFPTLIQDWRQQLAGGEKFPFYFVQLAPFRYDASPEALPEVWDAQLKTLKQVPRTGMAVTTDVGNIKDIHPKNKQVVGQRLSLWALADTYQGFANNEKPAVCSGPIYESMGSQDGRVRLTFRYGDGGLKSADGKPLTHFQICGKDRKFYGANAVIDGNVVIVSSDEVPDPVAVRFAWSDSAEPNLVNASGLPASPFRTDDFPMLSAGKHY